MWKMASVVIILILGFSFQSTSSYSLSPQHALQDTDSKGSFVPEHNSYAEDSIFDKDDTAYLLVDPMDNSEKSDRKLPALPKEEPTKRKRDTFWMTQLNRGGRFRRATTDDIEGSGIDGSPTITATTVAINAPTTGITATTAPPTTSTTPTTTTTTTTTTPTTTTTTPTTTTTTTTPTTTTTTTTPTTTTTTTAATTTTTVAPRPPPTVEVALVIIVVYQPALANPASPEFKQEAEKVETQLFVVYSQKYGSRFVRAIVIAFSLGGSRTDNVNTDVELVFNEASTEPLPQSTDVVQTLTDAVNDPSATNFTLSVDASSIQVTSAPKSKGMPSFRTNETFTSDLLLSTSAAFQSKCSSVKKELEPFFIEDFPNNFTSLACTAFSNGSIIHMTDITFTSNSTMPSDSQIIATLTKAAVNGTLTFTILEINGTAVSSAEVSSRVNLLSACGLVLLSLAVSRPW
ncbi:mucin-2-like [Engraulis encrasicolus]|uniref:mucin-2-like n=1 Tax=Engraulis encrasicolus TaxID=184585 RepID=UPI002FCF4C6C